MTRKDYIDALSSGLGNFDAAARQDILLEIEDHIDELAGLHPEAGEEALVDGLEKPDALARSLCAEAGIPFSEARGGESAGTSRPNEPRGGHEGPRARVTIDGVDLSEVIRKALDVAKFFGGESSFSSADERARRADEKARNVDEKLRRADERLRRVDEKLRGLDRIFEAGDADDGEDEEFDEDGSSGHEVMVDNIPASLVKSIDCQAKSADVELFVSDRGVSVHADGDEKPGVRVTMGDSGILEIRTSGGPREPGSLRIGVPVSVDAISITTASGDIAVEDAAGDLELHTASGDIAVERCSGDLRARTASGDIELAECAAAIEAQSASGDIRLAAEPGCDAISLSSVSGDLELRYPEDFDASIRWRTLSGDLDTDLATSEAHLAVLGAGLTPVKLSTTSGDIQIRKA